MTEWTEHAAALADEVTHPQSRWRDAVRSTPRHLLVPRWWWAEQDGALLADGPADPELWMRATYSNTTLVTRIGALHADHAEPGNRPAWWPTSSSTLPSLVVQMLRHARPAEGMKILDVGTASGYSTALLCHRFGAQHVTSVDVDPYLTDAARDRLAEVGHRPELVTVDATKELPGTYDRIVAMVAMPRVPASWLRALRPGGRLVTTLTGTTIIIGAQKTPDGGAVGRVERDWAGFMHARHGPAYPPRLIEQFPQAREQEGEEVSTGRYPVLNVSDAWEVSTHLTLTAPGVETHYEELGDRRTAWLFHPDGSWARASAEWTDPPEVHQSGPRRLWDALERIRNRLNTEGALPLYGAHARITPDGVVHLSRGKWHASIGDQ
ncbi:methyltransferase domain-containing protein [Streptomyces sp. TRM 70351]|uniref:methyltransferase domain-containing protein n=1 Tax=Streptomyces sp. TRM 70351 TaxID=3116552 RepID=UPI002E7B972E|nr:methyltransferase domain-containing protein [Streptomyces sp. TRM 70351]MEE1929253.1 methyltransferase domain-containing protein [Streptomyces sp. TRM 70351]